MKHGMLFAFILVLVGLPMSEGGEGNVPTSQGDWPQWRGPLRDGVSTETGLLQQWDEEGPPLLWKVTGLGPGLSTVSVVQGLIYTMGERDGKGWLLALDQEDGKQQWATEIGNGKPQSTPTVDRGQVFALGYAGDLVCVDAASGREHWRKNIVEDFGGKTEADIGYAESPLVDGQRVLCTPGDDSAAVVALQRDTAEVLWKTSLLDHVDASARPNGADGTAFSSIVVSEACGLRQYVQLTGWGLLSVRADDGELLWIYDRVANDFANVSTPIVRGDFVFCSTAYDTGSVLLKLVPDGSGSKSEEVYFLTSKEMQNHHGGMVLFGNHIYCGHGHNKGFPLCIEMKTGQVAWRPGRGPGAGSAAVVYADGHLYFRYEDGVMALIQATPEKYILKGTFQMSSALGKSWPHPVIVGGRLYLRDEDALLCYDLRTKREQ